MKLIEGLHINDLHACCYFSEVYKIKTRFGYRITTKKNLRQQYIYKLVLEKKTIKVYDYEQKEIAKYRRPENTSSQKL